MRQLIATAARALVALMVVGALAACGSDASLSGRYVGDFQGNTMEFNFLDEGRATFGVTENGAMEQVDCTYEAGETLISVSCLGSSGMTLTRVDGGLEADMGGVLVRYKKQ